MRLRGLGIVVCVALTTVACEDAGSARSTSPAASETGQHALSVQRLRAHTGNSTSAAEIELYYRVPEGVEEVLTCWLLGSVPPRTPAAPAVCPENLVQADEPTFLIRGRHDQSYAITVFTRAAGQKRYVGRSVTIVAKEQPFSDLEESVPPRSLPHAIEVCWTSESSIEDVTQYRITATPVAAPSATRSTRTVSARTPNHQLRGCYRVRGLTSGVRYHVEVAARVHVAFGRPLRITARAG